MVVLDCKLLLVPPSLYDIKRTVTFLCPKASLASLTTEAPSTSMPLLNPLLTTLFWLSTVSGLRTEKAVMVGEC
jgi:hypothetical protein